MAIRRACPDVSYRAVSALMALRALLSFLLRLQNGFRERASRFYEPSALNSSYWKLRALHRTPALSGLPLPKRRERSLRSKLKQPSDLLQSCSQDCAERNQGRALSQEPRGVQKSGRAR